jgi:hypothetical protein
MHSKSRFKLFLACVTDPLLKYLPIGIQQVKFGLVVKTQGLLEILGLRIIGVEVGKPDPAKIFGFQPMDHGRHRAAGRSGKTEKFHKLQPTRSQVDGLWIGGMKLGSAGGGNW